MANAVSCRRKTGNPNIHEYQCRAGASANEFQPGDLVRLDSSGELILAAAGHILGICDKAASTTDSTLIPVDVLGHDDEISIPCNTTTAENTLGGKGTLTVTTGAQTVTSDVSSGTDFWIIDFDTVDAVGADGGRLICKVLPAALLPR